MNKGQFRKYVVTYEQVQNFWSGSEQDAFLDVLEGEQWCEYTVNTNDETQQEDRVSAALMDRFGFETGDVVFLLI